MKRQKIQLIVLLALLVVLVGGYFGLKKHNEKVSAKESSPKYTALNLEDDEEITNIKVTNSNGDFELKKDDNGKWILATDESVNLDQDKIDEKAGYLKTLTSDKVIDNGAADADYGLETPQVVIEMTLNNCKTHTVKVGDYNQTATTYYSKVDDISTIYMINGTLKFAFDFTVDDIKAAEDTDN